MRLAYIASTAAFFATADAATTCNVTSLQKLLMDPSVKPCAMESGYAVTSLSTPTEDQMTKMCSSTACQTVLTQVQTLAPTECNLGAFALYADLVTPLNSYCESSGLSIDKSSVPSDELALTDTSNDSDPLATVKPSMLDSADQTTTPRKAALSPKSSTAPLKATSPKSEVDDDDGLSSDSSSSTSQNDTMQDSNFDISGASFISISATAAVAAFVLNFF
ncbi:hypothetical protein CCR75_009169 [Bremia lactucae]|uniref:Elicitin-like protein n=1 Tax=Bremia lactucae TaxID=4779 RepID=A0A976IG50_BRELC|nr:hypothetical protein CCR75_009169 [Bremia lactucae]